MPQFDISSFTVQLVWLFFAFLIFYFIFSWLYLPFWAFLLKTRKKLESTYSSFNLGFENYSIEEYKEKTSRSNSKNQLYS
jgi:hypothetical protein